jgi:hypothetical protein
MAFFRGQPLPSDLQHSTIDGAANGVPGTRQNVLVRLDQVAPRPIEWLWPGRIVLGRLTLVIGEPCAGKSFLALDLAARTSRGGPWPGADVGIEKAGDVVLWSGRDDLAETVRPRLDSLGADLSRIAAVQSAAADDGPPHERPLALVAGLDAAEVDSAVEHTPGCKLVVVDPLALRVEPGRGLDESSSRLLASLAQLAARRRVAVVAVVQVAGKSYGAALDHAARCLAADGAVDALWHVERETHKGERPNSCEFSYAGTNEGGDQNSCEFSYVGTNEGGGRNSCEFSYLRRCTAIKHSAGPELSTLAFELSNGRVTWSEVIPDQSPGARSDDEGSGTAGRQHRKNTREFAADWLIDALGEGPIESKALFVRAAVAGITRGTLRRAAAELGLKPRKQSWCGCWVWHLEERHRRTEYIPSHPPSSLEEMNPLGVECDDGVKSVRRETE